MPIRYTFWIAAEGVRAQCGSADPPGAAGQSLAARTHPTMQKQGSQGHQDSPSPRHGAPPWGQEMAGAWQGTWPARARLWEAGNWHCCDVTEVEAEDLG